MAWMQQTFSEFNFFTLKLCWLNVIVCCSSIIITVSPFLAIVVTVMLLFCICIPGILPIIRCLVASQPAILIEIIMLYYNNRWYFRLTFYFFVVIIPQVPGKGEYYIILYSTGISISLPAGLPRPGLVFGITFLAFETLNLTFSSFTWLHYRITMDYQITSLRG